ncbi:SIMPL domain-containing protein [Rhodococcus triatomae]|uniref:SIMPL domain-containing protein n=1 Tax=Rhodococcus triatomae TaxID=300028 RepID=A0A1G8JML9_9NOCA|nr:SIMPL domain-containing protein [Rhodococcus triatomae]QNG19682.1 SIMPL domain-containing protein [Rhodococcus triatomae]QNG24403.1 SIMPL domain-containing protein [Rhodococcus triatomae]SDI32416.1 hypothetical protein SAMN05444695_106232 [Rhodococcus triatomae]
MDTDTHTVTVTVTGHGEATRAPEQCTVSLVVRIESGDGDRAVAAASAAVRALTDEVTARHDASTGPITRWALDQVRHTRHRPHNRDGNQLPYVHRAEAALEVTFEAPPGGSDDTAPAERIFDTGPLSDFVDTVAGIDGVEVGRFEWSLTAATLDDVTGRVRARAVEDAHAKARTYAETLGCRNIRATAVADPGLLGAEASTPPSGVALRAYAASAGGEPIALRPEDVTVTADVHARFEAW